MNYSPRFAALCLAFLTPWHLCAQASGVSEDAQRDTTLPGPVKGPAAEGPAPAPFAETPEQACIQAHEQGQLLRIDGKLLASRQRLKACSLEACPIVVQRDCVRWLDEVSDQIPTVVFEAVTEHGAEQRVTVRHGERVLTEELDGLPIELDPGYYEFVFELPGREPTTVSTLLKQGEKNRLVSVDFWPTPTPTPAAPPAAPATPSAPTPPSPQPVAEPSVPVAVYLLGGAAIASGAVAVALALNTKAKNDNALATCAPRCSSERIDEIKRSALFTDIALGASAVSALAAALLYAGQFDSTHRGNVARYSIALAPASGGLWTGLEGKF